MGEVIFQSDLELYGPKAEGVPCAFACERRNGTAFASLSRHYENFSR